MSSTVSNGYVSDNFPCICLEVPSVCCFALCYTSPSWETNLFSEDR